jgi:hypothetical protein
VANWKGPEIVLLAADGLNIAPLRIGATRMTVMTYIKTRNADPNRFDG